MSSLKQIAANRRNALKSTGPVTDEGKDRSRCNAVRHGLTAETVIAGLEDVEDYQAFEAAVTADYDAETAVERELVLRLASILWRLRRATEIETVLFEAVPTDGEIQYGSLSPPLVPKTSELPAHTKLHLIATKQSGTKILEPSDDTTKDSNTSKDIGDCFLRLAALPTFPLDRLSRYEHLLWRQARQIIITLESLRRRKQQPRRSSFPFSFRANKS